MDVNQKLDVLYRKIEQLKKYQIENELEIAKVLREVHQLRNEFINSQKAAPSREEITVQEQKTQDVVASQPVTIETENVQETIEKREEPTTFQKDKSEKNNPIDLEKFIGENLANKIGIVVLVLGIALGTKYSIDHNLVTPSTRIVMGYVLSGILAFFGYRLFKNQKNFSAVLTSGAVASFYLVSYAAFSFFHFYSQTFAFILLVVGSLISAYLAILYSRQIIAQIGMVGAYAAPFLVSTGENNVLTLFIYVALLNLAILFLSLRQKWSELLLSTFSFTWLIYIFWYMQDGSNPHYCSYGLTFSSIYFLQFVGYFLILSKQKEANFAFLQKALNIANTLLFYGVFVDILTDHCHLDYLKGTFHFALGILYLGISIFMEKRKLLDPFYYFLYNGAAVLFIVLGIGVEWPGNWATLLWLIMGTVMLIFARFRQKNLVEFYAYPVLLIAFLSFLIQSNVQYSEVRYAGWPSRMDLMFNYSFLTGFFFVLGLGLLVWFNRKFPYTGKLEFLADLQEPLKTIFPALCIFSGFQIIHLEIDHFWNMREMQNTLPFNHPDNIANWRYVQELKNLWRILFALIYVFVLSVINYKFIKNQIFTHINLAIGTLASVFFLIAGLLTLSNLRASRLYTHFGDGWVPWETVLFYRYVSLAIFGAFWLFQLYLNKKNFLLPILKLPLDVAKYIFIFWILCSEILHWMEIAGVASAYKTSMSLTSGGYALFLIILGIWKKKVYLRVMAIVLFTFTLIKLFLYDISHMSLINKTVVFIALGALLLMISFLYNKYKSKIQDSNDDSTT